MGLDHSLVVVRRNNQGIEIVPRSTKGRQKARVPLQHTGAGTNRADLLVPFGHRIANVPYGPQG